MHNFGKIKQLYNNLLSESIVSKNEKTKKVFGKYVKTLKESKALTTQFLVYNNIESKSETNEFKINEFIKANIALMETFDKEELKELNTGLFNKLPENSILEDSKLYESINTLIFTTKRPSTVDVIVEATSDIVDYIKENEPKLVTEDASDLPPSLLTAIYVDKFNSEYEKLDEEALKLVKTILESDDEGKTTLFNEVKKDCLTLVNVKLTEGEDKERLLSVKEKLLDMEFVMENHVEDISDLIELKETLGG